MPSQRLTHAPDGALLMTVDVGGLLEITPWRLGCGAAIEVLDPPELRENARKIAGERAAQYLPVPSPRQPSCHTPAAS